jgi:predicted anti-sigma-YlaC factor YlaD
VFSKSIIPMRCRKFEARLEDYFNGAPDPELDKHLEQCASCRAALADSQLAGNLLRQAWDPSSEPRPGFLVGVMARIQDEKARLESPAAFWRPLEFLASRVSLTAAIVLLALSGYMVGFAPHRPMPISLAPTELSASDFPQPPGDPATNEEVLQTLAERNHGH